MEVEPDDVDRLDPALLAKIRYIVGQPPLARATVDALASLRAVLNVESNLFLNMPYDVLFQRGIHVVTTGAVFAEPVAELGLAMALQHEMLVAVAEGVSLEHVVHYLCPEVRYLRPAVVNRLSQQPGMTGAGDFTVGIVVEHVTLTPPLDGHWYIAAQNQRYRSPEVFGPLVQPAQRGFLPVVGPDQFTGLGAAAKEGIGGEGLGFSHAMLEGKVGVMIEMMSVECSP